MGGQCWRHSLTSIMHVTDSFFAAPEYGSDIECKATGVGRYLRQDSSVGQADACWQAQCCSVARGAAIRPTTVGGDMAPPLHDRPLIHVPATQTSHSGSQPSTSKKAFDTVRSTASNEQQCTLTSETNTSISSEPIRETRSARSCSTHQTQ